MGRVIQELDSRNTDNSAQTFSSSQTRNRWLSVVAGTAALLSCNGQNKPNYNTPYPLEGNGSNTSFDQRLEKSGDRGLRSNTFNYDGTIITPGSTQGTLVMKPCFSQSGEYRIISQEEAPRPGYLVDKEYTHGNECDTKYPVDDLHIGDREKVLVGIGKTPLQTYTNMREYTITRPGQEGIVVVFDGLQTIDPTTIHLRDATPAPTK